MKLLGIVPLVLLAFLLGVVGASFAAKEALPHLMFKEVRSPHDYGQTLEVIRARVAAQPGWRITAEIDQQAAILAGGGADVGPYRILKICNGAHAARMLGADDRRHFGVMMPVSVAVYERADGHTYVSLVNGSALSKIFGGDYAEILQAVRHDMEEIFRFLHLSFDILD